MSKIGVLLTLLTLLGAHLKIEEHKVIPITRKTFMKQFQEACQMATYHRTTITIGDKKKIVSEWKGIRFAIKEQQKL
jgi:hypothetical protein